MGWVDIEKQRPRMGMGALPNTVMVYSKRGFKYGSDLHIQIWSVPYLMTRLGDFTHWRNLPKPPKGQFQ